MARRRRAPSDDAPLEILDEAGGPELGMDFGVIVATTICLVAAVALVWVVLAEHYAHGPLS